MDHTIEPDTIEAINLGDGWITIDSLEVGMINYHNTAGPATQLGNTTGYRAVTTDGHTITGPLTAIRGNRQRQDG